MPEKSPDVFDLQSRRVLITGASRGIGQAIAAGFAARGAHVVGVARSVDGLTETAAMCKGSTGTFTALPADLRSVESITRVADQGIAALGGLDVLVNNAADDHDSSIEDTSIDTWQRVLELNLQSCFAMCQQSSAALRADGGGKVINVASVLGLVGLRDDSAYVSAKHGLIGLTRALSLEWARRGVQVNALAPGFVETAMVNTQDEGIAGFIRSKTPMGRWAAVDEMVGPAVFLASRASDFMTGQVLVVDGGYTAQ
jgi:NAD(P)-dependent dehydrogenase (short-subunit alcohol dehydrogenase family)